jgi:hypothetical protein
VGLTVTYVTGHRGITRGRPCQLHISVREEREERDKERESSFSSLCCACNQRPRQEGVESVLKDERETETERERESKS